MISNEQIQSDGPRWLAFPALLCFCMIISLLLTSCSKKEQEVQEDVVRPVKMMTITAITEELKRKFPGIVRAAKRADLSFQVPGTLKELPVEKGRPVKAGQLVARLDQRNFKNNLLNVQGQMARSQAALAGAQSEYDRILRIREQDPGAASESLVVRRRQARDKAQANLESLQSAVAAAKDELGYTTLRAPFDGMVSKRYVDNFQEVQAKQAIVSLDDISSLEILVKLPEILMATLKKVYEKEVRVHAEFAVAPGMEYPLTVKEFATRADSTTQTFQVVFEMQRPSQGVAILPGMTANVVGERVIGGISGEGYPLIPAIAVFADYEGVANVWVVERDSMTVSKRKVLTGELAGQASIQINQGLQVGEMIAISGVNHLREGMKVRPYEIAVTE